MRLTGTAKVIMISDTIDELRRLDEESNGVESNVLHIVGYLKLS